MWIDSPHGSVSGLPSGPSHLPSGESQFLSELVLLRHLLVLGQAAPASGRSVHLAQLVEGKHRLPAGRRRQTSFIHPRSSRRLQRRRLGSGLLPDMKVTSGFKLAELLPLLLTFEREFTFLTSVSVTLHRGSGSLALQFRISLIHPASIRQTAFLAGLHNQPACF